MDGVMLLLGILIGCLLALLMTWLFWRHGRGVEPFFMRLLQQENRAETRVDSRLMLHELLHKVEELSSKTQRMDMELQELRERYLHSLPVSCEQPQSDGNAVAVVRLFREGLAADEIAAQLQMGRGEVELLISLEKKPDWVVAARENF